MEAPVAGRMALAGVLLKLGSFGLYVVLPGTGGGVMAIYLVVRV